MIYSDRDIKALLIGGNIVVDPAPDLATQLGTCSLDLRLSNQFKVMEGGQHIDPHYPIPDDLYSPVTENFIALRPGDFVLALTVETVTLADPIIMARLQGRSTLGRLGIVVHATAGNIDAGWQGRIVLELANHGKRTITLTAGMRICSLTFERLSSPAEFPYNVRADAKYRDQQDIQVVSDEA